MIKVMCDVDSTLIDFQKIMVDVAQAQGFEWPQNCGWWIPPEQCGMNKQQFNDIFRIAHSPAVFLNAPPFKSAVKSLNDLVMEFPKVSIHYVSHRHEEDNDTLFQWLRKWDFPQAYQCISTYNKAMWIREQKPDIVIDDRVRTMVLARDLGVKYVYSLIHPWNCNLKNNELHGIYLRDSWDELYFPLRATIDSFR